ncbi:hypothetical protein VNO77_39274 [Canavalia gladiata]|uniref:Uncharacterized protein n=1 Tax=Canavalia gladiata TaxID=3824 RepID=A0AAN9KA66_CANGL
MANRLSELARQVEKLEWEVNATAKNEAEYLAVLSSKAKAIHVRFQTVESKSPFLNSPGSDEIFSAQEAGKSTNVEWKEQVFKKELLDVEAVAKMVATRTATHGEDMAGERKTRGIVQRIKNTYFTKLNALYHQVNSTLQQLESSPQEPQPILDVEKFRMTKKFIQYFLTLLRVSKSQITTEFNEKLDKAEKLLLQCIGHRLNVSSQHQGQQHSADVRSSQLSVPLHSSISQMEILEMESSPQASGTQNYDMTKEIPRQIKMCLKEQQVEKQYRNLQQGVNKLSIIKGPGNALQQRTQGAQKATEAYSVSVNTQGISASPLIEDGNNHKEIYRKPTLISDQPSAAMQHFLEVVGLKLTMCFRFLFLTSISPEALSTSIGEIREVVYLNDLIPTSESVDGPPTMVQQQKQPSLFSQGRKMSHSTNAIAFDTSRICAHSCESINQLVDAEKPDLTSVTSKLKLSRYVENCSVLQEIKAINSVLINSVVVIGEKDSIESEAGEAAEHGEGLVITFLFNPVTIHQNLISHLAADKKSVIKPIRLLVPTNYPFSPPVILDQMPMELREGLKDLSTIAKSKLRFSLQRLNQPWSLGDIAITWDFCARETIREYAEDIGGGTFSSKYGDWEICQNYD